jgi:hypothetical protein
MWNKTSSEPLCIVAACGARLFNFGRSVHEWTNGGAIARLKAARGCEFALQPVAW